MEAEKLRSWMKDAGLDVWAMIDAAISLAAADHAAPDIRARRDGIRQRLYSAGASVKAPPRKCGSADAAASDVPHISPPPPPVIQEVEKVESRPPSKEDQKQQMKPLDYPARLALARKRLCENFPESERAKKGRVNEVIEIHQIPIKPNECVPASVEPISPLPPPATQKEEKVQNRPSPKEEQKQQMKPFDDPARLALARKRLRENYLDAEQARKSRVPKVIEIRQIPIEPDVSMNRRTYFHARRY